jgi:uncharacterized protein YjbJ (UPF0337 family)
MQPLMKRHLWDTTLGAGGSPNLHTVANQMTSYRQISGHPIPIGIRIPTLTCVSDCDFSKTSCDEQGSGEGRLNEAVGKAKELAGESYGSKKTEGKGIVQKSVGKSQAGLGDAKEEIKRR